MNKFINKMILSAIICLLFTGPSFAINNMEAMKFLTINALMQYGQQLYERGNFDEACAVFNHVLAYDSHQAQALEYLKDMGHSPLPSPEPILMTPASAAINKSDEQMVNKADLSDTESLKKAISAEQRIIETLRSQIKQIRSNMTLQSAT